MAFNFHKFILIVANQVYRFLPGLIYGAWKYKFYLKFFIFIKEYEF